MIRVCVFPDEQAVCAQQAGIESDAAVRRRRCRGGGSSQWTREGETVQGQYGNAKVIEGGESDSVFLWGVLGGREVLFWERRSFIL